MSDLVDTALAVRLLASEPILTFDGLPEMQNAFTSEPRFSALMRFAADAHRRDLNDLLRLLTPGIVSGDPYQCSRIALACGTLVEYGGDARLLAPALVQALPTHLGLAGRIVENVERGEPMAALFAREPDAVKAWEGMSFVLLAAMTSLCRDVAARVQARVTPGIGNALPPITEHFAPADFLSQLLGYTDEMLLLVLHPGERKGWRVRLTAVNTNFHLFTLLQARLIGPASEGKLAGEATDSSVAAVARGDAAPTSETSDHARLHFHDGGAVAPDGTFSAERGGWLWGEGVPGDIPVVGGERVVLLGPMVFGNRSWNAGFFANIHDALRSDVEIIETLTDTQVTEAMEKLHA